jgi:hypothetical protein
MRYRWRINGKPQPWANMPDDLYEMSCYAPIVFNFQDVHEVALDIEWPERRPVPAPRRHPHDWLAREVRDDDSAWPAERWPGPHPEPYRGPHVPHATEGDPCEE